VDEEDEDAVLGMIAAATPEPNDVGQAAREASSLAPELPSRTVSGTAHPPETTSSIDNAVEAVTSLAEAGPASGQAGERQVSDAPVVDIEEPTGRAGRRARSSVSYKEPSLNK
jgi:hypothetical protein